MGFGRTDSASSMKVNSMNVVIGCAVFCAVAGIEHCLLPFGASKPRAMDGHFAGLYVGIAIYAATFFISITYLLWAVFLKRSVRLALIGALCSVGSFAAGIVHAWVWLIACGEFRN